MIALRIAAVSFILFAAAPASAVNPKQVVEGCRESVGISLDEAAPANVVSAARHVYVFAPRRWTAGMVERAYALAGINPRK